MKVIISLLLIFISFYSYSQSTFRMHMKVQELTDSSFVCKDSVLVYWGFHQDTIWFEYEDKQLVYMPYLKQDTPEIVQDWINSFDKRLLRKREEVFIRKDKNENYYLLDFLQTEGILIESLNLTHKYPSYLFCWSKKCKCN